MTTLVTGASGLTGSEIVARLQERGTEVIAIVRDPARAGLVPKGVATAVADCADATAMSPLLERADTLVHVAGILLGPRLAAMSALAAPARVVVVSSAAVGSRHRRSAALYRQGEDAIRAVRADTLFVRPTMIYGSVRDRNVHHAVDFARRFRFLPIFGDGTGLVQPIHFEDLAAAAVELARGDASGLVDAGGATPISLRDAAVAILNALGLAHRIIRVPMTAAMAAARIVDLAARSRSLERLERMTEPRTADNSRLVELVRARPRDFRMGVRDQVERMRRERRRS